MPVPKVSSVRRFYCNYIYINIVKQWSCIYTNDFLIGNTGNIGTVLLNSAGISITALARCMYSLLVIFPHLYGGHPQCSMKRDIKTGARTEGMNISFCIAIVLYIESKCLASVI